MANIIDSLIDSFTDFFGKLKENKVVTLLLVALVSLYTTLYIKSLSKYYDAGEVIKVHFITFIIKNVFTNFKFSSIFRINCNTN